VPPLLVLLSFFLLDPFHVLRSLPDDAPALSWLNRDYVSTEVYLKNEPSHRYDSFILGSSRSHPFSTADWVPYLNTPCKPFHYDAFGESLYGIACKLRLLHASGAEIRHALILFDFETLSQVENSPDHIYRKHPRLTGEPRWAFQWVFLRDYFSNKFFFAYLDYTCLHHDREYFKDFLFFGRNGFDPDTNDLFHAAGDAAIDADPQGYFQKLEVIVHNIYKNVNHSPEAVVHEDGLALLKEIRDILQAQSTDFQILIPPVPNQIALPKDDVHILTDLFGQSRVHDYSGVTEYSKDITNFYDASHLRPPAARRILREVYSGG